MQQEYKTKYEPATVKHSELKEKQKVLQFMSPSKMQHASRTKKPKEKPIDEEVIKYFKRMVKN